MLLLGKYFLAANRPDSPAILNGFDLLSPYLIYFKLFKIASDSGKSLFKSAVPEVSMYILLYFIPEDAVDRQKLGF